MLPASDPLSALFATTENCRWQSSTARGRSGQNQQGNRDRQAGRRGAYRVGDSVLQPGDGDGRAVADRDDPAGTRLNSEVVGLAAVEVGSERDHGAPVALHARHARGQAQANKHWLRDSTKAEERTSHGTGAAVTAVGGLGLESAVSVRMTDWPFPREFSA